MHVQVLDDVKCELRFWRYTFPEGAATGGKWKLERTHRGAGVEQLGARAWHVRDAAAHLIGEVIGALARLYMRRDQSKKMALLFWFCMGASFLIKGPVTPMVAAYAGMGAWVWTRATDGKGGDWWRVLLWWPGPAVFVGMVLPWFLWIQAATDGQYIKGAVGKDLKDKFTGASEGHGGWPFYHLTHIPFLIVIFR